MKLVNLLQCSLKLFFDKSAISKAFAKPTIPGTFSVPERLCLSWPPPKMIGLIGTPFLIYSKPVPLGP